MVPHFFPASSSASDQLPTKIHQLSRSGTKCPQTLPLSPPPIPCDAPIQNDKPIHYEILIPNTSESALIHLCSTNPASRIQNPGSILLPGRPAHPASNIQNRFFSLGVLPI